MKQRILPNVQPGCQACRRNVPTELAVVGLGRRERRMPVASRRLAELLKHDTISLLGVVVSVAPQQLRSILNLSGELAQPASSKYRDFGHASKVIRATKLPPCPCQGAWATSKHPISPKDNALSEISEISASCREEGSAGASIRGFRVLCTTSASFLLAW